MHLTDHIPADPERDDWDVVVIGTGMGGGTIGHELARLGRRVLFLEKGRFLHAGPGQEVAPREGMDEEEELRLLTGRWPRRLRGSTSFGPVEFFAPLGCGSAGTTGLYGAQLERFAPSDFGPRAHFADAADANLPEAWPVSYAEMLPFYRRAETLFRVCGTQDPLNPDPEASLRTPPPLSERDEVFRDSFRELGLHPYRAHVGYQYVPNCYECSDICPIACKSDAGNVCVAPALEKLGAHVLPECEVVELVAEGSRVRSVRARWRGRELSISAKVVALAAGAYMTPLLLLNSRSGRGGDGLANGSGMVGRNLMLHASDFLTIDPGGRHSAEGPTKTLALNDFYLDEEGRGGKLGTLQTVGLPLQPPFILAYLRYAEERDPRPWRKLVSGLLPRAAELASRLYARRTLFATIVEDLPYRENRIVPDPKSPNGMRFEYRYTRELRLRNRRLRRRIARTLAPRHRVSVVTGGANNINYGHVCGTCRFGDDPETSVLDASNRAHDLDNLYVVDASFFPSSGGTNPSLTIAANALRVAGIVHERLH
ncbi:MAG: GMC family oxidoreductase [Myxococcota bacterium]|nr:GMC family oxidoreductase [Myxococcota bacterium]